MLSSPHLWMGKLILLILSLLCPERIGDVVILSKEWIPFLRAPGFPLFVRIQPGPWPVFSWKTQQSKLRGLKQSQHYSLLMTLHLLAYNGAPQSKLWPSEANFYHLWTLREPGTAGIITNKMRSNFSISPYLLFTTKYLIQASLFPESFSHISLWI